MRKREHRRKTQTRFAYLKKRWAANQPNVEVRFPKLHITISLFHTGLAINSDLN